MGMAMGFDSVADPLYTLQAPTMEPAIPNANDNSSIFRLLIISARN